VNPGLRLLSGCYQCEGPRRKFSNVTNISISMGNRLSKSNRVYSRSKFLTKTSWSRERFPNSQKEVSREIGSQKNYFSKQLLKRSTSFESPFPDSTSFESRLESLTLTPPKSLSSKRRRGEKTTRRKTWTLKKKISIPLLLVNYLWHVTSAPSNVTPPKLSPV